MDGVGRAVAVVLAGCLGLAIGVSGPAPARADRRTPAAPAAVGVGEARDEATALAAARRSGRSVEVAGLRTETRSVFANPSGTLTLQEHARPVRVRDGTGWRPADPTLHRNADGSVTPGATQVGLVLSGGGTGPLLRVSYADSSLTLTWPGRLPAPVLGGATATYPEVLPGVDLRLTADVTGYQQELVIRDREAARNPAVRDLRLGLVTHGASVRVDEAGNLSVLDRRGATVLHGPAPRMWDSSPGEARQARARVSASGGALTIVPDLSLLTNPATRYPVVVEPYLYHPATTAAWAHVSKHFSTTSYYNSKSEAKVGYYNDRYASPTSDTYRAFFRMETAPLNGKQIFRATFSPYEIYSYSCQARAVELWLTSGISSSTTWAKQPTWVRRLDAVTAAKGWGPNCPAGPLEFDATSAVVEAAANNWSSTTLGLRATNESDTHGWKKFRNNPTLTVEYNSVPQVPTALRVSPAYVCTPDPASAPAVSSLAPRLIATLADPDSAVQSVRARFELAEGGVPIWSHETEFKQASSFSASVPPLTDGQTYAFRVQADDGIAASDWTDWCYFTVDSTAPSLVPGVSSTDYPEADPVDPVRAGGVGKPGTFRFTPNGIADVAAYQYDIDNPEPAQRVAATGTDRSATVSITPGPSPSPLRTLYVRSVDSAGNQSAVRAYDFYLAPTAGPAAVYRLDEGSGTVAADDSGNGRTATLTGGGWAEGRLGAGATADGTPLDDKALTLSGSGQYAATAGPVIRTDSSFTVAAWVRLRSGTANATALTQAGAVNGGFQLYYSTSFGWVFNRHVTDADGTAIVRATAPDPPQLNRWTHLAGVYDLSARQLRLYVNGALAGTASFPDPPWHASGALQIGRLKYEGTFREYWPGEIDDVRVYDRVVYPAEIAEFANRPAVLVGHWAMDEGSGVTVADASGRDHPLTAAGGVTWAADRFDVPGAAVETDGTTGRLTTSTSVATTDRSYSVSAWVKLASAPSTYATILAQDGTYHSGLYLQYSAATRKFVLSVSSKDGSGEGASRAFARSEAVVGRWTHLVGVYDAAAQQIRLYVDGEFASSAPYTTAWQADGPVQVGRSRYAGAYNNYWPGSIDEVRVYQGVLSQAEIDNLAFS
ncbi:LamG domain-containing protein [Micromonospora sp. HM5-17]|uniref:LamG domain-containing protein n=1 Tax=Micromonospora sp. HM5-17 TaxID=2487710 RepID=UPI000F476032|nr:LamG domain-containing protein [Micromonospora sp. HM5-17]ROT32981.1 LamG domain-containing protein [Micromonospora sp. HM5-17]